MQHTAKATSSNRDQNCCTERTKTQLRSRSRCSLTKLKPLQNCWPAADTALALAAYLTGWCKHCIEYGNDDIYDLKVTTKHKRRHHWYQPTAKNNIDASIATLARLVLPISIRKRAAVTTATKNLTSVNLKLTAAKADVVAKDAILASTSLVYNAAKKNLTIQT